MRLFFYSIAMALGLVAAAWAQGCGTAHREPVRCFYSADAAKYYPDEAGRFGAGSAVKVCRENGIDVPHLFATPVKRGDAGVCYFWVRDMDKKVTPPEFPDRRLMMRAADGACPAQDDASYIENESVPDGIFASLMNQWNAGAFEFAPLNEEARKRGDVDFNAVLKTAEGRRRFALREIDYAMVRADDLTPDKRGGSFNLIVYPEGSRDSYYFWVDWSQGAFRVVNFEILIPGC